MFTPKTIKGAVKPILVVNFVVGMGCFDPDGKYQMQKLIQIAYTASFVIFINVVIHYTGTYFGSYFKFSNLLDPNRQFFWSIFYYNEFLMSILLIAARFKAELLPIVISLIDTCDQKMEDMGLPKRYAEVYKSQIYALGLIATIMAVCLPISYYWHVSSTAPMIIRVYLAIVINFPVILIAISDFSFCFWVRYTRTKFHQLNGLLESMMTKTTESPVHERNPKMMYDFETKKFRNQSIRRSNGNANTMRAVKQTHLELIKIVRTMNDAYGMQVLVTMSSSVIFVMTSLYNVYRITWLGLSTYQFLQEIVPLGCWLLLYIYKIFIINHMCAKTTTEATSTGELICELYEPSTTKEFRAEIRDFTLQMVQNPLVFTACGFFDMDHTFIQGVVGTISTYLIILIQVEDMAPHGYRNSTVTAANATFAPITVT